MTNQITRIVSMCDIVQMQQLCAACSRKQESIQGLDCPTARSRVNTRRLRAPSPLLVKQQQVLIESATCGLSAKPICLWALFLPEAQYKPVDS